eukprot:TRINITY_DN23069_c0_g1_i1.p1 TRINITY_DN23069_c0_g1~~TRINITY_DN23069_c0_g1_i1.p1  ORF type:complete len:546 (-),score=111.05 TRINITY_DN23069_c0_g1_i1:257-1894(-)
MMDFDVALSQGRAWAPESSIADMGLGLAWPSRGTYSRRALLLRSSKRGVETRLWLAAACREELPKQGLTLTAKQIGSQKAFPKAKGSTFTLHRDVVRKLLPAIAVDRLQDCLLRLSSSKKGYPFLSAKSLPRRRAEEFLDFSAQPTDLQAVEERLLQGFYEAAETDAWPLLFWLDLEQCLQNHRWFSLMRQDLDHSAASWDFTQDVESLKDAFWSSLHLSFGLRTRSDEGLHGHLGSKAKIDESAWPSILNEWTRHGLRKCLRGLRARQPAAQPFLHPVPWQKLGLVDYLEVVAAPIDLNTVGRWLDHGDYDRTEGVSAKVFFADVRRCWSNCKLYFEHDEEAEAVQLAREMEEVGRQLEQHFWRDREQLLQMMHGRKSRDKPGVARNGHMKITTAGEKKESAHMNFLEASLLEADSLIHQWCGRQLRAYWQKLDDRRLCTLAASKGQGRQVGARALTRPALTLAAVMERLSAGAYEDDDDLISPDMFWTDVRRCFSQLGVPQQLAAGALAEVRTFEEKFYESLTDFESSLIRADAVLSAGPSAH